MPSRSNVTNSKTLLVFSMRHIPTKLHQFLISSFQDFVDRCTNRCHQKQYLLIAWAQVTRLPLNKMWTTHVPLLWHPCRAQWPNKNLARKHSQIKKLRFITTRHTRGNYLAPSYVLLTTYSAIRLHHINIYYSIIINININNIIINTVHITIHESLTWPSSHNLTSSGDKDALVFVPSVTQRNHKINITLIC